MKQLPKISCTIKQQNKSAQHTRSICFCVDEAYIPYALFVVKQMIEKDNTSQIDICLCVPNLNLIPDRFLQLDVRFVEIEFIGLDDLPIGNLSLTAYHRLFLPKLFVQDYEYIIYLDADIYINKPFIQEIQETLDKFPTDFCVAGAVDIVELLYRVYPVIPKKEKQNVNYVDKNYHQYNHSYRNSGVLIFNISSYLESGYLEKILNYAFNNVDKLKYHDQSALNGALLDNIILLPFIFNWQLHNLTSPMIDKFSPYIIHFIGKNKPWNLDNEITKPYQEIYQQFLQQYFPELANQVADEHQRRLKIRKYDNPIREFISKNNIKLKTKIKSLRHELKQDEELINKTTDVLSSYPFQI